MSDATLHNYFMLRGAILNYQQMPWQLSEEKRTELKQAVSRELKLAARALSLPVANEVHVEDTLLYQSVEGFLNGIVTLGEPGAVLNEIGLEYQSLAAAIASEMRVAMILEHLVSETIPTEQEVFQWFKDNPRKFIRPESREVFQILITVNGLYPENLREAARKRMDEVAHKARMEPGTFGELALSHSECPSAIEAGRLGVVTFGSLYPELDQELFTLKSGDISCVVESPLGFHLLRCGYIEPSRQLAWEEVRDSLTKRLTKLKRKQFLQQWLQGKTN